MASSIEAVYMVETSESLRETQKQLLCGDTPLVETDIGYRALSKYSGIPIIWTENIRFIPTSRYSFEGVLLPSSNVGASSGDISLHCSS